MNLKKLAESFNYLSGVKNLSTIKEDRFIVLHRRKDPEDLKKRGFDPEYPAFAPEAVKKGGWTKGREFMVNYGDYETPRDRARVHAEKLRKEDGETFEYGVHLQRDNTRFENTNSLNESITIDKKEIDPNSVEIEGVDTSQGPDDGTSEAFVSAAKFKDGQMLNDEQLDMMNDSNDSQIRDLIQSKAEEKYSMGEGTCGYSVDGKPADKPAGPDLIKIREAIKKELRNLKK